MLIAAQDCVGNVLTAVVIVPSSSFAADGHVAAAVVVAGL